MSIDLAGPINAAHPGIPYAGRGGRCERPPIEGTLRLAKKRLPWKKLILACAWCNRMLDDEGVWRTARPLLPGEALTHGICPDCLDQNPSGNPRGGD